jgi:hypothetical protein
MAFASHAGEIAGNRQSPTLPYPFRLSTTIHRYLPLAGLYFFFNPAGLPLGLFYTTIFAPVIFLWLYLKGVRYLTFKFLIALSPFITVHFLQGVSSPLYYLRSLCLLWTVLVAVSAICYSLTKATTLDRLFEELIILNFGATIIAILLFPTPLRLSLWHDNSDVLAGVSHSLRLNLLNTEPSAYALLMLPLLLFATLRFLRRATARRGWYLLMIGLPFILCQSFGGISMFAAAFLSSQFAGYRKLLRRPSALLGMITFATFFGVVLFTQNPISQRILQVISGGDSSTSSRTIYSFLVAFSVASTKSLWWGAGLGQAKLVDVSNLDVGFNVGVIPNAMAGTFAELGIVGVLVRLGLEIYLFFRTRVYRNSFRIAMFVVAFITQLTGSYITDVQEYVTWFLAFWPLFPEFELNGSERATKGA